MSGIETPISTNKRDLSSPEPDLQQPTKKPKPILAVLETEAMEESGSEPKVVEMKLQEADLRNLSEMLKQIMLDEMKAVVKEAVDGFTAALHEEVKQLKTENAQLRSENASLGARVRQLEKDADDLEQYTRRNSVRVSGIPEVEGEYTDDMVLKLSQDMKAGITRADIDRSHRVGRPEVNKTRPIIVKFATYNARRRFMENRSTLKTKTGRQSVYINEDLTLRRNKLLYQARQLVKSKKLQGAWSVDGRIFVKSHADKRIVITCDTQLREFSGDE